VPREGACAQDESCSVRKREDDTGEAGCQPAGGAHRVQLTTDGDKPYLEAVEGAFGMDVDFAQLVKLYGAPEEPEKPTAHEVHRLPQDGHHGPSRRQAHLHVLRGAPEPHDADEHEARFTRLTNAFTKKLENLEAALALHFMWYNFGRVHQTLRVTPAMEAGVADHIWTMAEVIGLL
jgi:hypothetical protein